MSKIYKTAVVLNDSDIIFLEDVVAVKLAQVERAYWKLKVYLNGGHVISCEYDQKEPARDMRDYIVRKLTHNVTFVGP